MFTRVICVIALFFASNWANAQIDEIVPFTSSNLPIIVINTNGGVIVDEPKITADMGIVYNGTGRNNVTDPFNDFSGTIGIEIRGSSSQFFPKKQYGIELRDATGTGINASLLTMPAEEDWILFAPYNDKSLMRDALAYKLGRDLGRYAPRTKFCELVLNDVYQGIYVLTEKVKRDGNRVDINKLNPEEIAGDDLTGGYIIKIDKFTGGGGEGWNSVYPPSNVGSQQVFFQYEYPKAKDIVSEQKVYIQQFVSKFEDVLANSTFADPVNGYAKYIDVNSFVDFFIMQEITKNVDGYRLSTFLHKQKDSDGGKLVMGPIWDFNLGFGNADYCTSGNPEGFVLDFNNLCDGDFWLIPFWWKRLLQDNAFRVKVATRWSELRTTKFRQEVVHAYIDSVATVLNAESQQRNFRAWKVLNRYIWPNYYVGPTFQSEVDWLKGWVSQRLSWLDQNMPSVITAAEESVTDEPNVHAFPNPFSGQVNFEYSIQKPGNVSLRIYDALGRSVHDVNFYQDSPGKFTYSWGLTENIGLYYYTMQQNSVIVGNGKISKK
ncbi:MAG: CotH kinase family protein [Cyclobacteriaceae bacterium]|nr:CotH kinase family protein [Cyclobacteriaceae bacterium]MDH4296100.1 CotH kinase family protein [Cyclobacteriaceae bacterium]MDH5250278.1 CotH kinase family protein [Cyclobacteriaceae bacterium]